MKLCIGEAVLLGMVAVSACWGQPQATSTPTATATPLSPMAKAMRDHPEELRKMMDEVRKAQAAQDYHRAVEIMDAFQAKYDPEGAKASQKNRNIRRLRGAGHSDTVSVARDELALEAAAKAAANHDVEGMMIMHRDGELFSVPVETKVRDLGEFHWQGTAERGMAVTKVRILEGEHYGKAGWVPEQWLESQAATQR